jgi:hypothetical protein
MTLSPSDLVVWNWRYRAAEMRAISDTMKHEETRATMERYPAETEYGVDKI